MREVKLLCHELQAGRISSPYRRSTFARTAFVGAVLGTLLSLLLLLPSAASATELPAKITEDTTLTAAGNPYTGGSVSIEAGVSVKAEPGVVVHVTNLTVKGTLKAEGTAEEPILFTSAGPLWGGIRLEAGSGASVLDHVEVRKVGNGANIAAIKVSGGASPTITNSTIQGNSYWGIQVQGGGAPEIANNQVLKNGRTGIYYAAEGKAGQIRIHDNLVEGNKEGGIQVNSGTAVTNVSLSGNVIRENDGEGLSFSGGGSSVSIPPDIADNVLIGNTDNYIYLAGTVDQSMTWPNNGHKIVSNGITIASEATLTLGAGLMIENRPSNLTVKGTLKAEGTAEEPILFTSAGPLWGGIRLEAGSGASVLDHVEVRKVGNGANIAAIKVSGGASPTITNSTIQGNSYWGIQVQGGGAPEIANNQVLKNGRTGIYYAAEGKAGQIRIHDNLVEGNKEGGIQVNSGTAVTGVTLGGNVVILNDDGIDISGGEIPVDVDDNILLANSHNALRLAGSVVQSGVWSDRGYPFELDGSLNIDGGASLTMEPGLLLKGKSSHEIAVSGTLKAQGTAAEPIVFTSEASKAPGEWRGLKFSAGSGASVLEHVEVKFGGSLTGSAGIRILSSSPTISHSEIRKNKGEGIKVTESGSPKIEWNRFRGNGNGLSYSGAGKLVAPNNDWGCATGPKPAGCGDSVTSNVEWKPAVQLPEPNAHCRGKESQCGEGADPVSLATGEFTYSHRDMQLTNKSSAPLELTRSYSSGSSADTGFGPGWSQSGLSSATELASGAVLILRQDGRQDLFYKVGEGAYKAPSGVTSTLSKVEGVFELTTLEGTVYRFDESGRIASITDDHGLKATYGYNASGRLATITDPSAQVLTFTYDSSNHITKVTDSTGREVKYAYTTAGDLKTVTDPLGGVTEYTYDSAHRITSIKDPRGNVFVQNTYDGQGRVIEQLDGLENLWELEYKEDETIVTEPEGGEIAYDFDGQDRVVSETDQLGKTTTTSYNAAGLVDEVVKPGGAKWAYGYDSAGNLTFAVDPEEGERSYEYDGQNRLTDFTDARGNSWSYEWSEANDLVKITDPEEGETALVYDEAGLPLSVTDANEHKTEFSHDARGNLLSITDPLENETSFGYSTRNYLVAKTLPGAVKAEALGRNALGELTSRTTPEGHTTSYAYNATGMPTEIIDPAENVWKIAYNAMGRPTTYTDPLEQQASVAYDGNLQPVKITDRRGKETHLSYDLANRLTETQRPEGGDWSYDYDGRGNRISVVDPRENETTYEYDLLDRMTKSDEPLEVSSEYDYDAEGNLTAVTDPRGNTTSYAYDKLGRPTAIYQPLEKTTTMSYDGVGNLLGRVTATDALAYDYDASGRLEEVSAGESVLRSFSYDEAGRMTSAIDAEGKEIEVVYDEDGKVAAIDDGRGQSLTRSYDSRGYLTEQVDGRGTLEYGYDKLGRLTSLSDPQAKVSTFAYNAEGGLTEVKRPGDILTTNTYDDAGRLAETTTESGEPATVLEALEYSYDPAGNVLSRIDARLEQETGFTHDALNRLTGFDPPGEGATAYGYDAAGNRTQAGATTYAYNALNQMTEASDGTTYGYDGAGRLISMAKGEEETTYGWDALDHLATTEGPGGVASYAYDALERLSKRAVGGETTAPHYGDLTDLPTYDADGEGEITTSYVRGAKGLLAQRSAEATSFPLSDAHGDVTAVSDATGEVLSRQSYDPWGSQLSGPALEMGYLGAQQRRFDPTSGLIQMGARSYAPDLGRFMTEDPVLGHVGIGASFDRYTYVWNNPLAFYDLDGRDVCVPTPFGSACAGEAAQDVGNALGSASESAWDWTQPGRQWIGQRAQDFVKSLKEQCGDSFGQRSLDNFTITNKSVPGIMAPILSGGAVNKWGGVASRAGTYTPVDWIRHSRNPGQLPSVARAAGVSWIYASLAWEAGVGIGSFARAGLTELYC